MANADSFVDEVTEELRRDRASNLLRRWGWVAVVAVIALVAAASVVEWRRSAAEARAEAFGDAVVAALSQPEAARPDAIAAIAVADDEQAALRDLLRAAALVEAGDASVAAADLVALADAPGIAPRLRHLAMMKALLTGGLGDAAREAAMLEELIAPGAPFRPLALEVQAMAALRGGDEAAAIDIFRLLAQEAGVSDAQRRRAVQTIVALGASPEPA